MKLVFQLLLFLMFFLIYSCKKENAQSISSPAKEEIMKESEVKKSENTNVEKRPKDSINRKNVVAFLTEYGKQNREDKLLIKTRMGNIKIKLYDDTPLHRASFIFLAKMGYFDTTCFYRVVPEFVIQGGESERLDTQRYKARYQRYKIPPEFKKHRQHKYGALALARDWKDNPKKYSTAFEFYIVQNRKGAHHLDGEHTVFGEVISGFDAIDKIVNEKTGNDEWPLDDVFIKVEVLD